MSTLADCLYVALFAIALPLWDYLFAWPAIERRLAVDAARARRSLWLQAIVYPWGLVVLGAALWAMNGRPWATLGLSLPAGWRLWVAVGLVLLIALYHVQAALAVARDRDTRSQVRQQFFGRLADVLPHTRNELKWFGGVSLTAGFCEEFLYRGYLIWVVTGWLDWWGAASVSVMLFALGHSYQGWSGILRTGIVGAILTVTVALLDSLWPAIILHSIVDLGGGVMAWLALRDETLEGPAAPDRKSVV